MLKRLAKDQNGASIVEYGLLAGLIALVAIPALQLLGTNIIAVFQSAVGPISQLT